MQNNVTDLLQKLHRSLDNNYNVVDMPTVIEIFSTLEKTTVTKELLEATRLGKHINELRRRTTNESLAKRAKELVKKWRCQMLSDANGQAVKTAAAGVDPPVASAGALDTGQAARGSRKRGARSTPVPESTPPPSKRHALNGQARSELDFSDNSNCSVKDLKKTDVIFINSDSNSSLPEGGGADGLGAADTLDVADGAAHGPPKKRGRKKGSKNHKNLLLAAEESFTSKMSAVSRNSKVKTTQELLADLKSRAGAAPKAAAGSLDIELRAAQLTESLSRIDQKLNPQKQINKNVTPIRTPPKLHHVHSRTITVESDDEIVDVVGDAPASPPTAASPVKLEDVKDEPVESAAPLTVERLLSQLPPVDASCLEEPSSSPACSCPLPAVQTPDVITVQIVDKEESLFAPASPASPEVKPPTPTPDPPPAALCSDDEELASCPARLHLRELYALDCPVDERVGSLHARCLPNVSGNWGAAPGDGPARAPAVDATGLYVDIVPRLTVERLARPGHAPAAAENFQKYSISIGGEDASASASASASDPVRVADGRTDSDEFREWHETLDVPSYNGETLRVLPYVIID